LAPVVSFIQNQQSLGNKPGAGKPASDGKQEATSSGVPAAPKPLKPVGVRGKDDSPPVSDVQQKRLDAVENIEQKVRAKADKALRENPAAPTKRGADKAAELAVQLYDDIVEHGKAGPLQEAGLKALQIELQQGELSLTALNAMKLLNNHLVLMSKHDVFKEKGQSEFAKFVEEASTNVVHTAVVGRVRKKDFEGAYQLHVKMNKGQKPSPSELDGWAKEAGLSGTEKRTYDLWKKGH
jgi:hypothetical protein